MKKIISLFFFIIIICKGPNAQTSDWLWAKGAGGIGTDESTSIVVDAFGNTYMTGYFNSPTIKFGNITLTNASDSYDIFLAKYDNNGNIIWAKRYGGIGQDNSRSLALDTLGNVFMSGYFGSNTINFDAITLTNINTSGSTSDIFLTKFDTSGNVIWAKRAGGTNDDGATSIKVDITGNIYIAGSFNSSSLTFGTTTLTNAWTGFSDIFLVKYDGNGYPLWAKSAGGVGIDIPNSITVDTSGNVYMTGNFTSPYITFGSIIIANADSAYTTYYEDIFISKYGANGNEIWIKTYGGRYSDIAQSVALDDLGNIFLTGKFTNSILQMGSFTLSNEGGFDIFISKFDTSGNVISAKSIGGVGNDEATSVIFDNAENIYLAGNFSSNTLNFGTSILTNLGGNNLFIAKYNSNENLLWAKNAGGTSIVFSTSIAVDFLGNTYIAGDFESTPVNFGYDTLTNADTLSGYSFDIFLAKLSSSTGLNEFSNPLDILIFPNPTSEKITIITRKKAAIDILNINGQIIKTVIHYNGETSISLEGVSRGVYIVRVKTDKEIITKKIVKE